jgi:hypothetical protein
LGIETSLPLAYYYVAVQRTSTFSSLSATVLLSPLHYAAKESRTEIIFLLLENGADIEAKDKVIQYSFCEQNLRTDVKLTLLLAFFDSLGGVPLPKPLRTSAEIFYRF